MTLIFHLKKQTKKPHFFWSDQKFLCNEDLKTLPTEIIVIMAIFQLLDIPNGVLILDIPKGVDLVLATAEGGEVLLVS